jgi:type II secretory pathway component PulK
MIAVLVVVTVLALAAYRFADLMQAEQLAADSYQQQRQAQASAHAGIDYAAAVLANALANGQTNNFYDNPSLFQNILVRDGDSARQRSRFSIVSVLGPDAALNGGGGAQNFLYGVTDETGKLNINALFKLDSSGQILYNVLMQLPNMTDDVANAIIDWIDPDSTPRSNGAEDDYYMGLDPPYHAKNGPLDSLEELLYVRGVTPQLLFGNDRNRNGVLDPDEDDGSGTLDMGWSAYLTVYSREQNVDSTGTPRIYVNDSNLQNLQTNLTNAGFDDGVIALILAYRMYGPASGGGSGSDTDRTNTPSGGNTPAPSTSGNKTGGTPAPSTGQPTGGGGGGTISLSFSPDGTTVATTVLASGGGGTVMASGPLTTATLGNIQSGGGQNISSLYALINAQVTIPAQGQGQQATTYTSPLTDAGYLKTNLPMMLDKLTTKRDANLPPRVNVNTAPSAVLAALAPNGTPLLDSSTVQTILSTRPATTSTDTPDAIFQTPAWLITEASLTAQTMQSLEQYITARSQVYRVQSLGYSEGGGATARVEAVIDVNAGRPRILYYRDLTGLGKGYNLSNSP